MEKGRRKRKGVCGFFFFKEIKEMCYYSSCSYFDCCYCGGDEFWIRGFFFVFKNSKQAAFNEYVCVCVCVHVFYVIIW